MSSFKVTILGSGAAVPFKGRHLTSHLVNAGKEFFLVDCGEGTQFQIIRYGIKYHKISRIFISHLHGDHFYGLFGLLSTMHLNHRAKELHIHGPRGLDEVITTCFRNSTTVLSYPTFFHETAPDKVETIYDSELIEVNSFPLKHSINCTGFVFREKKKKRKIVPEKLPLNLPYEYYEDLKNGRDVNFAEQTVLSSDCTLPPEKSKSYAFCSDTRFDLETANYCKEVNLIYHEATFLHKHLDRAEATFHTTAKEAGIIAKEARAKQLIIGHYSARYGDLDGLLEEAKAVFPNTLLAIEGKTYSVG